MAARLRPEPRGEGDRFPAPETRAPLLSHRVQAAAVGRRKPPHPVRLEARGHSSGPTRLRAWSAEGPRPKRRDRLRVAFSDLKAVATLSRTPTSRRPSSPSPPAAGGEGNALSSLPPWRRA